MFWEDKQGTLELLDCWGWAMRIEHVFCECVRGHSRRPLRMLQDLYATRNKKKMLDGRGDPQEDGACGMRIGGDGGWRRLWNLGALQRITSGGAPPEGWIGRLDVVYCKVFAKKIVFKIRSKKTECDLLNDCGL